MRDMTKRTEKFTIEVVIEVEGDYEPDMVRVRNMLLNRICVGRVSLFGDRSRAVVTDVKYLSQEG